MIRPAEPRDGAAIGAVVNRAFGDEGPVIVDLIDLLRVHPCGRDGLEFVAEIDGAVVGHTMVTRSRLDTLPRTIEVGVLSPLAVDPDHQRQGVGRELVAAAIQSAVDAGLPLLFVEGDPAYYARLGFVAGKPLGFRKPSVRVPDAAFQVMPLAAHEAWMTGTLVYAEPFWQLDCVGLRDPEFLAWLADEIAAGRQL